MLELDINHAEVIYAFWAEILQSHK